MNLKDLQKQIQQAKDAYYNGIDSGIDDAVYDDWIIQLKKINPNDPLLDPANIGATATSSLFQKVKHKMFMGSLDNSMNQEDFEAFDKRVGGGPYWVNPKIDGASLALYYVNGKLDKAVTRGDGAIGDDVTENVVKFKNVPLKAKDFSGSVRGEAILYTKEWEKIDPNMESNPRNIGSGIIQRLDGENADLMRVLAFDIYPDNKILKTEEEKIKLLKELGFQVSEGKLCKDASEVIVIHKELGKTRSQLPFWIDGLVVKINDLGRQAKLGLSGKRPKSQTAFKFKSERVKTKVKKIIWTVGHTGAQIPTAQLEPIRIGGTTVQNVLLCNMDYIKNLDIAEGDVVEIIKAGDIIPRCVGVIDKAYICPECNFLGTLKEQEDHHAQKHK